MTTVDNYIKNLCNNALAVARYGCIADAFSLLEQASFILEAFLEVGACSQKQFLSLDFHILVHYHVISSHSF